jgi:DNA-binding MarR family transcriptional regulator
MAEAEFQTTGLAPSPAFIVMAVNKQPGLTAGEIADVMQLQPSTVTRLVDRLETDGYVTRHSEGKFVQVYPTHKAKRLDGPLRLAWQNLYRRYTEILGEEPSMKLAASLHEAGNKLE